VINDCKELCGMLGRNWAKAEGGIIDYSDHRDSLTGGYVCDYVVDVKPPDQPAFRATIRHRRLGGWWASSDFAAPSKGDVIGVLFDPSSHKVKFDLDDPQFSLRVRRRAQEQEADDRLHRIAEGAPGTPPPDQDPAS
jgi:hypothetical protein